MSRRHESGSALALVLWVVAVLLIISLSFSVLIQSRVRRMEMLFNRFQASLEAYSGLQYGLLVFLTGTKGPTEITFANRTDLTDSNRYYLDGTPVSVPLFEKKTRLSLQDYSGLVSLRRFYPEFLDGLMKYFGASEENRRAFVDSLLDWIDLDDLIRLNGAEKDYYETLGYRPRNSPLMTLDEILLIRGMDESLYPKIQPFLILGNSDGINPNVAPFEVLMSFPHMTEDAARKIMEFRKTGFLAGVSALSSVSGINFSFYERAITFVNSSSVILKASCGFGDNSRYMIVCHLRRRTGVSTNFLEVFGDSTKGLPVEFSRWRPYDITLWKEEVR